ncbi:hypothetical protein TNCT_174061 [Trichonephila clavata]|uniref:Uncharacterized protein n=1 Tax=Trichonephila clavata TaxID=2740835 RepID=A0A8X6HVW1_TRICU|nr:hypothetical protein TNCT_174061 [Trichonephila clavata]
MTLKLRKKLLEIHIFSGSCNVLIHQNKLRRYGINRVRILLGYLPATFEYPSPVSVWFCQTGCPRSA